MFRRKQSSGDQSRASDLSLVEIEVSELPIARIPTLPTDLETQRQYEELAQSLGFAPSGLVRVQLLSFFHEQRIALYDYKQVASWLKIKRGEAGAERWYWRPLRDKDAITQWKWGEYYPVNEVTQDDFYTASQWECRPFARIVPMEILQQVKLIEEKLDGQVKFFVSYYSDRKKPTFFIMVRPAMCDDSEKPDYKLIFGSWEGSDL